MTEPPPQAWWEELGRWGMTGAGAGIGLFLALVVLVIASLSSPAVKPVAASGSGTPNTRASQPAAVENAGVPTVVVQPLAAAPEPVQPRNDPPGAQPLNPGSSLAARRAIYRELHHAGMQALSDADRQFPLNAIPQGRDDLAEKYLLGHQAATALSRRARRLALTQKHGITAANLDAIQREGNQQRWPVDED